MSLPSIPEVARELGLNLASLTESEAERMLVEAMRRDVPLAVRYLHTLAHKAENGPVEWTEDPGSSLGKQLIRVHASDALRPLAEEHFCHGQKLLFVNCCGGIVGGGKPPTKLELMKKQIAHQAGPTAYADC